MRRLLLLALTACGSGDPDADAGADARANDAPPPQPDASPDFPRQGGLVSVGLNTASSSTNLYAGFYKTEAAGVSCQRRVEGACSVTTCADPATAGVFAVSAGNVSAVAGDAMLAVQPGGDGMYLGATMAGLLFAQDATVTITAAGADVPAFTGEVTVPPDVTVLEPAIEGLTVDRAAPLTVRWTPNAGDVYVYLGDQTGGAPVVYPLSVGTIVRCVHPSSAGEAVVPASVLGDLAAGTGIIAVTGISERMLPVSGFAIQARIIAHRYQGSITLQ